LRSNFSSDTFSLLGIWSESAGNGFLAPNSNCFEFQNIHGMKWRNCVPDVGEVIRETKLNFKFQFSIIHSSFNFKSINQSLHFTESEMDFLFSLPTQHG
jgi:hypothetical protein